MSKEKKNMKKIFVLLILICCIVSGCGGGTGGGTIHTPPKHIIAGKETVLFLKGIRTPKKNIACYYRRKGEANYTKITLELLGKQKNEYIYHWVFPAFKLLPDKKANMIEYYIEFTSNGVINKRDLITLPIKAKK